MNRTRSLFVPFAFTLASSVLALACSSNDSTSSPSTTGATGDGTDSSNTPTTAALDAANGGITAGNEAPAFGDTNISSLPDVSSASADTLDTASGYTVKSLDLPTTGTGAADGGGVSSGPTTGTGDGGPMTDPLPDGGTGSGPTTGTGGSGPTTGTGGAATAYHLALVWGHIPAAHDATTADSAPTAETWTGSVSVDSGVVSLKRTLMFDAKDSISPRTDPKQIDFVSHTLPFVDGIFVRAIIPANGSSMLHVKTASLSMDIDLSTLPVKESGVSRIATAPDEGMAYIGYRDVEGCQKGLVLGRWIKDAANLGELRGRVLSGDGDEDGFVRGIWGQTATTGANRYIAKIIGPAGEDRGVSAGTYGDGTYDGTWEAANAASAAVGLTSGIYSDGYDKGDGRGVWVGRWSETKCAE